MKRIVQVTAEHIAKGVRSSSFSCPIACAIVGVLEQSEVRVHPGNDNMGSGPFVAVWNEKLAGWDRCILPSEANRFAKWFDQGRTVQPFEFEMELP